MLSKRAVHSLESARHLQYVDRAPLYLTRRTTWLLEAAPEQPLERHEIVVFHAQILKAL
jgi:hypothetical protein